jgi:hypothetical protein
MVRAPNDRAPCTSLSGEQRVPGGGDIHSPLHHLAARGGLPQMPRQAVTTGAEADAPSVGAPHSATTADNQSGSGTTRPRRAHIFDRAGGSWRGNIHLTLPPPRSAAVFLIADRPLRGAGSQAKACDLRCGGRCAERWCAPTTRHHGGPWVRARNDRRAVHVSERGQRSWPGDIPLTAPTTRNLAAVFPKCLPGQAVSWSAEAVRRALVRTKRHHGGPMVGLSIPPRRAHIFDRAGSESHGGAVSTTATPPPQPRGGLPIACRHDWRWSAGLGPRPATSAALADA